jgi:isocitrate dehydrogenase
MKLACVKTIEDGIMTGDLYALSNLPNKQKVDTETFIVEVAQRLGAML